MNKWLFGLGLIAPVLALSATFPMSGVDFNASTMTISATSVQHSPVVCLGQSVTPSHSFTLAELGFSESSTSITDFGDYDNGPCFQQAGDYTVEIDLYDVAGNYTDVPTINFTITSADPDASNSTLVADCTDTVANNSDACVLSVALKDEFGNEIEQEITGVELFSPMISDPNDANLGLKFRNGLDIGGLNFDSANRVNFIWNRLSPAALNVTALAPSIEPLNIGDLPGNSVSRLVDKVLNFTIDNLPEIEDDGTLGARNVTIADIPVALRFSSPIEVEPSFNPLEFTWKDEISIETNLIYPSVIGLLGNIDVTLESISDHLFSEPGDVDPETGNPIMNPLNETYSFPNAIPSVPTESEQRVLYASGAYDKTEDITLTTTASYSLGGAAISFISGGIGKSINNALDAAGIDAAEILGLNGDNLVFKNIGVSIEGVVIGEETQMHLLGGDGGDDAITRIASIHSNDVREDLIQNAYEFVRNAKTKITSDGDFEWSLFNSNNNVVVVDLSGEANPENAILNLGGTLPSGKATLIVVDGNVVIDDNLSYGDMANDSFGLILLREESGAYPERGNIYVRSNVKNIAGSLFADGGFFSNDTNVLANANTGNRNNQLILRGSLLSRNTIGGSRVGNFTPWEETTDLNLTARYDLHEVRRYPGDGTNCAPTPGNCDINTAAFVIRLDQKSSLLAPPGFSN